MSVHRVARQREIVNIKRLSTWLSVDAKIVAVCVLWVWIFECVAVCFSVRFP